MTSDGVASERRRAGELLSRLQTVLRKSEGETLLLHAPDLSGKEAEYVAHCVSTGWVSSAGEYVDRFEDLLRKRTGARHAIAVTNGTSALQVALTLAGVRPGDEVVVPALSFVATANAVSHCGAVPHFVDCDVDTLCMDPRALEAWLGRTCQPRGGECFNVATGRRVSALVPVHTFGHMADMDGLARVARQFGLALVEDAAEALGSTCGDRHAGTMGLLGILSFNGNKIVTTGGGGAILTDRDDLAQRARHLTTTAKRPHRWEYFHDQVGWNFRLPSLNAAMGCAQMERLSDMLTVKRHLASRYRQAVHDLEWVRAFEEREGTTSNYWLNALILEDGYPALRDAVLQVLNEAGFQSRPTWALLSSLPMYTACPAAPLPVASRLEASVVCVPSGSALRAAAT